MVYRIIPTDSENLWKVQKGTRFLFWTFWQEEGHFDWNRTPARWNPISYVDSIAEGEEKIEEYKQEEARRKELDKAGKQFKRNNRIRIYK